MHPDTLAALLALDPEAAQLRAVAHARRAEAERVVLEAARALLAADEAVRAGINGNDPNTPLRTYWQAEGRFFDAVRALRALDDTKGGG